MGWYNSYDGWFWVDEPLKDYPIITLFICIMAISRNIKILYEWGLKMGTEKTLYDYKLGECVEKDLMNGIMKAPNKLVKIGYTFQDKNQTQMEVSLKHKDFIEDEDY